jgi:hypothetical protein
MLPVRAVSREDAMAEEPAHGAHPRPETKVVELCRQHCLDVLGLANHDQRPSHQAQRLRVLLRRQVALAQALEHFSVGGVLLEETELVEA